MSVLEGAELASVGLTCQRTGAAGDGHAFSTRVGDLAANKSNPQPAFDDTGFSPQQARFHRPNEADLHIDGGKIFTWQQAAAKGNSHR